MSTPLEYETDFVVVGSGAGGATTARVLAEAGHRVLILEEGPRIATDERPRALLDAMILAVRDAGTQSTAASAPIPVLQGRLVGGSTAINSGIIWRMPDDVRADWRARFGLGDLVDERALDRIFSQIERDLGTSATQPEILGGNGHRMAEAARAVGLTTGQPMTRNAPTCHGSARCLQGCPHAARLSMDVTYIPMAERWGARVEPLHRVRRVRTTGGVATGVEGVVLDASTRRPTRRFRVEARRAVVLAAGVVHSPTFLLRLGLRGAVGRHFQSHPGAAVVGRFKEPLGMGFGATQAYEVPCRERGYKLESLSLPPELLATRIPGAGVEWQRRVGSLDHYAQWAAQVRMEAHGTVRLGWGGGAAVRYEPTERDVSKLHEALVLIAEMMFAAGAEEVYPGVTGVPDVLRTKADVEAFRNARVRRRDLHLLASHLFGTARASHDPSDSVVDPRLESRAVRNLYVMDGSVFPTNLGVNPQHSIMAVAWRAAEWLANK
ncbi:MAG: GMC family oxidoreductase [Polyangiales bacterium]